MEREPYMRLASAIAGLLIAGSFVTTFARAQHESEGAPVILSPTDGAVVRSPVTMTVGFKDAFNAMHDEETKRGMAHKWVRWTKWTECIAKHSITAHICI